MSGSEGGEGIGSPVAFLSTAEPREATRARGSQRLINHNCFNSINDVFRRAFACGAEPVGKRMNLLEYFYRDVGSSKGPPQARDVVARAIAMPCADRLQWNLRRGPNADPRPASARPATASSPPQDLPLRQIGDTTADNPTDPDAIRPTTQRSATRITPAPSRIGQIPTYGLPAASGAANSGFNSLNRTRKKPKFYPGQAKRSARRVGNAVLKP